MNTIVQLFPLECSDREQFILDNQEAFNFYVNRCGFHIVEFFNKYHQDPNDPEMCSEELDEQFPDGMFQFEKVIR